VRADADDPGPDATFFARLSCFEEEVDPALRPITKTRETRQISRSAETQLEAIKQGV
jgi:hypothetical protein